jgi:hypothetical protein
MLKIWLKLQVMLAYLQAIQAKIKFTWQILQYTNNTNFSYDLWVLSEMRYSYVDKLVWA